MYESEKNEIVLKDEYKALYPVIGAGDEEDDGIFLKKHGGNIYLCGSSYAIADIYADGATISSFILTYEGRSCNRQEQKNQSVVQNFTGIADTGIWQ